MNQIKLLPIQLANQIAAGEVIERPASVLKELMENAIDSTANSIDVEIELSGRQLIRVIDNGSGIAKNDLVLAFTRHATSKISHQQDLNNIASLGFRGEALASICSISRIRVESCLPADEHGWEFEVDEQQTLNEAAIVPSSITQGTRIEVRDLFYNTPARRKFLRSDKTEFRHIEQVFTQMALSYPNIKFTLVHDGRRIKKLGPAIDNKAQLKRIEQLFGKGFCEVVYRVDSTSEELPDIGKISLSGWVADHQYQRSQNDQQYFFINGRCVKDKVLTHAIRQAMQQEFELEQQPAYVLNLHLAFDKVDVNVHPTKHEVRFYQPRMIHDFIVSSLVSVLHQEFDITPNADYEVNLIPNIKPVNRERDDYSSSERTQVSHSQISSYDKFKSTSEFKPHSTLDIDSLDFNAASNHQVMEKKAPSVNYLILDNGKLCLLEDNDNVVSFSIEQMIKVLNYLDLLNKFADNQNQATKYLLIPERIKLSEKAAYWQQLQKFMQEFGFNYEIIEQQDLLLRKIPRTLFAVKWADFFQTFNSSIADISCHDGRSELARQISDNIIFGAIVQDLMVTMVEQYFYFNKHEKLVQIVKKHSYQEFYC